MGKSISQDLVVATRGLNMEVSLQGRPECGESAARPDEARRAENGGNLSRGTH